MNVVHLLSIPNGFWPLEHVHFNQFAKMPTGKKWMKPFLEIHGWEKMILIFIDGIIHLYPDGSITVYKGKLC